MKAQLPPDVISNAEILGSNVREARQARRWTQKELAERMLTSVLTVQRIEAGNVAVSLENYLRALDVFNMASQISHLGAPHTDEEGVRLRAGTKTRIRKPGR